MNGYDMSFLIAIEQFLVGTFQVLELAAWTVLSSTTLSALLPNSSPNKLIQLLLDLLNILAGNVHRNLNECDRTFAAKEYSREKTKIPEYGGRR